MKVLFCPKCVDFRPLDPDTSKIRYCQCRRSSGRYLTDGMTCVVNTPGWIFGLDTATFYSAVTRTAKYRREGKQRVDFFTGWIHALPDSNVIVVRTKEEVRSRRRRKRGTGTHGRRYKKMRPSLVDEM